MYNLIEDYLNEVHYLSDVRVDCIKQEDETPGYLRAYYSFTTNDGRRNLDCEISRYDLMEFMYNKFKENGNK